MKNREFSHYIINMKFILNLTSLVSFLSVILHSAEPTIEEFCNRLHRGIISQFSHALVWGRSAKFQPQRCGKDHILMDEDIVQIVKKV